MTFLYMNLKKVYCGIPYFQTQFNQGNKKEDMK